jgi:hypothetical protein
MATPYDDDTPRTLRRFETLACLRCGVAFAEPSGLLFCLRCTEEVEKSLSVIGTAAS